MTTAAALDFSLPTELERGAPPARRDDVRLMVGSRSQSKIHDNAFADLTGHLRPGDVLVINTSATLPAAIGASTEDGEQVVVHFSSSRSDGSWTVEVRKPNGHGSSPYPEFIGGLLRLDGGASIETLQRHEKTRRLWIARVEILGGTPAYLHRFGRPIRYGYASHPWPLTAYQTVYAREPGSAEMPSAGRPFTTEMITTLVASGIAVVPLVLHAGVASFEEGEHPAEEWYSVPVATEVVVNDLRSHGGRVIAIGTSVVRALETVANGDERLHAGTGYTDLVIEADTPLHAIDGLLTGWHEPRASHLDLVEAVAGRQLLETMYQQAVDLGYAWHEFGDSCLILP